MKVKYLLKIIRAVERYIESALVIINSFIRIFNNLKIECKILNFLNEKDKND
jgi:hypothetical protein